MSNEKAEYTRKLEETLKRFLEPIKGISFPVVIEALTGCRVLEFDRDKTVNILKLLTVAAAQAGNAAAKRGAVADRPNEAGN